MDREKLIEGLAELPLVQYEFFKTAELPFSERVRQVCRQAVSYTHLAWVPGPIS